MASRAHPQGGLRLAEPLDRADIRQHGQVDITLIHQVQATRGVGEPENQPLLELLRNHRHQCAPAVEVVLPVENHVLFKSNLLP